MSRPTAPPAVAHTAPPGTDEGSLLTARGRVVRRDEVRTTPAPESPGRGQAAEGAIGLP